jgi:hypothetical protein
MGGKVSIRHKPGTYNVYRNLSNTPWRALAEYVDNSLQSFENNLNAIRKVDGLSTKCIVEIIIEPDNQIVIRDNAGGISEKDFERAFEPAHRPADNSGLSEFGMGLKVASIWLADNYEVRTTTVGSQVLKSLEFKLKDVVENSMEELSVVEKAIDQDTHFTEILLTGLSRNAPTGNARQMVKIKSHLSSIYRQFIRNDRLELNVNGEVLHYQEPKILNSPLWNDPNGISCEWKKEINIDTPKYKVYGFIALLETMKQGDAGLSLFRRGRVIEGSHDEKYKHRLISGSPGSPRDKRIFGELELEGFEVSFEKGKFIGNNDFEALFQLIRNELSDARFPLIQQGERYRKVVVSTSEKSVKKIANTLKSSSGGRKIYTPISLPEIAPTFDSKPTPNSSNLDGGSWSYRDDDHEYVIKLEVTGIEGNEHLYQIIDSKKVDLYQTEITARLNLNHSFFKRKPSRMSDDSMEAIVRIVQSLIIAEIYGPTIGLKDQGVMRRLMNTILNS